MFSTTFPIEIRESKGGLTPIKGIVNREGILNFQHFLAQFPQGDYPLKHHFAEGQYGREILIAANNLVVGKIHKHSHLNIISQGECTVVTEFGSYRIKAPYTFVSLPGTKRALFTHSETIWTTVHVTDKTDLQEIEDEIIAPTFDDYDAFAHQIVLAMKPELDDSWGV